MTSTTATTTPSRIEVLAVSAVSAGPLKALATVRIGPALIIHKFRIIQQVGQKAWVSPPQERWEDREGQAKYTALVELTGTLKTRVEAAVLQAAQAQGVVAGPGGQS